MTQTDTAVLGFTAQTSSRYREPGGGYTPKSRGHAPQISISDDNHHVTEAIGYMYGDEDSYDRRRSRPLSFVSSPLSESMPKSFMTDTQGSGSGKGREPMNMTTSNGKQKPNGQTRPTRGVRMNSFERESGPLSPTLSMHNRTPSNDAATATTSFPLNDIDYESNPAAVAQELSNLQALRRMSMDVTATGDPDLPTFNSGLGMPPTAPSASADEDDTSRLFWVPARIHPELAPKEFKSFLESKADQIKRRSGELSRGVSTSGSNLRRKKSMLSRQIDNKDGKAADGYTDGAERLERKRSLKQNGVAEPNGPDLQQLEALVNDPKSLQRLSLTDTIQHTEGREVPADEDMPILPAAPKGLRRSTRTTYRRGSLNKGSRVPLSQRARKAAETDTDESPATSPTAATHEQAIVNKLSRVQTDPSPVPSVPSIPEDKKSTDNFARPNFSRPGPRGRLSPSPTPPTQSSTTFDSILQQSPDTGNRSAAPPVASKSLQRPNMPPSHFRGNSFDVGVPEVVETPPSPEEQRQEPVIPKEAHIPERRSSHDPPPSQPPQGPLPREPGMAPKQRPPLVKQPSPTRLTDSREPTRSTNTLENMAAHPSPLPGNSTRTDSLSFIPTLTEDKKADNRTLKIAKAETRKSSWGWLLGNEEKEKEKRKEEEAKQKRKTLSKPGDKSHDNTRLDVLQTSIDGGRGRESLVLDRGDFKLDEERKKESARKTSSESNKKEKDSGLFSSIFGGSKKKEDKDSKGKKHSERRLSPDPPRRDLKPDIDYNWTRFSILEERAIYRMAHIKLANPRRALYSQVLLSNFMYSYLAKVQQMHPQMQLPASAAQKKQNEEKQRKQTPGPSQSSSGQPDEYSQYQRYQESQQQQAPQQPHHQQHGHGPGHLSSSYAEDYDDDYEDRDDRHRPSSRGSKQENGQMYGSQHQHQHRQSHQSSGQHYPMPHQQQHSSAYDDSRIDDYDNDMW